MRAAGLDILVKCLKFPQAKSYSSRDLSIKSFQETMPRYRRLELRSYLHFANNVEGANNDKL